MQATAIGRWKTGYCLHAILLLQQWHSIMIPQYTQYTNACPTDGKLLADQYSTQQALFIIIRQWSINLFLNTDKPQGLRLDVGWKPACRRREAEGLTATKTPPNESRPCVACSRYMNTRIQQHLAQHLGASSRCHNGLDGCK